MAWTLTFPQQHPYFMSGPDDAKKAEIFPNILNFHKDNPNSKCLQIGVPSWLDAKYGSSFIAIDLYDKRPCIDFAYDLAKTPFPDNHFDLVLCNAILEHVKDPFACANEIERILKPGGIVWAEIPFVQPYHPYKTYDLSHGILPKQVEGLDKDQEHGGDYWRFTPQGLQVLFKNLNLLNMLCIGDGGIVFHGEKKS